MDDAEHSRNATERIARQFIGAIPFAKAVGMTLEAIGDGRARIAMPYSADLVGEPSTGVIHGGAVSALMDTCGGAAVMCHAIGPISTATIDLRIDYMRAATPGQRIVAEATCHHVARSVAFVRAVAHDETDGPPVATATGAFTFQRAPAPRDAAAAGPVTDDAAPHRDGAHSPMSQTRDTLGAHSPVADGDLASARGRYGETGKGQDTGTGQDTDKGQDRAGHAGEGREDE